MRWLAHAPLALAAMMMSVAGFSTTNPPGGSSTCTNSCDCHSSFSSDAPTTLTQAAPRPASVLLGATPLGESPRFPCQVCELKSAFYSAIEGEPPCHKDLMPMLQAPWLQGYRSFGVSDALLGDPCPHSRSKELDIETTFWDRRSPWNERPSNVTTHWTIPEHPEHPGDDVLLFLDSICCVYEKKYCQKGLT
jgi:hypothetical protein